MAKKLPHVSVLMRLLSTEHMERVNKLNLTQMIQRQQILRQFARARYNRATKLMHNLPNFRRVEEILHQNPLPRKGEDRNTYRKRLLKYSTEFAIFLTSKTSTRKGYYENIRLLEDNMSYATGEHIKLNGKQAQALGRILDRVKSDSKLYLKPSDDYMRVSWTIYKRAVREQRLTKGDLMTLVDEEMNKYGMDEDATDKPRTGIEYFD